MDTDRRTDGVPSRHRERCDPSRISTDLDVLVNARITGRPIAAFAGRRRGSRVRAGWHQPRRNCTPLSTQSRHDRLARTGGSWRAHRSHDDSARSNASSPGRYASARSNRVVARGDIDAIGSRSKAVATGAIVGKAIAVAVDDVPNAQRLDFVFLLSLVDDPFALADQLTTKDRQRISARKELIEGEHRVWNELDADARDRASVRLCASWTSEFDPDAQQRSSPLRGRRQWLRSPRLRSRRRTRLRRMQSQYPSDLPARTL